MFSNNEMILLASLRPTILQRYGVAFWSAFICTSGTILRQLNMSFNSYKMEIYSMAENLKKNVRDDMWSICCWVIFLLKTSRFRLYCMIYPNLGILWTLLWHIMKVLLIFVLSIFVSSWAWRRAKGLPRWCKCLCDWA